MLAFTEQPAAVSVSHRFLLNLWRTAFSPQAFNNSVPVGRRILLQVTVLDHFNSPVRRAGIPVYLTQARYTSTGVRRAFATINGHLRKTVLAMTNRQGTATFYIVGTKADIVPTTLSAHLKNKQANYVYGGERVHKHQVREGSRRSPAREPELRASRKLEHVDDRRGCSLEHH